MCPWGWVGFRRRLEHGSGGRAGAEEPRPFSWCGSIGQAKAV